MWRTNRMWLGAVALLFALTGCDAAQDFTSPDAGESMTAQSSRFAAFENSVIESAIAAGIDLQSAPVERPIFMTDPANDWVVVEGSVGDQSVEAVIGAAGGELRLGDHWLLVPSGTVDELVRFRMTPVDDGTMHVDLSATRVQAVEVENDVGHQGFDEPVYLSFAVNPANFDPNTMGVAWMVDGSLVIQQSFVYEGDAVVGALRHFSGYVLVAN